MISTRQAAKKLGIHPDTLANYITVGKLPAPTILDVGTRKLHAWTEEQIEHARELLPKIKNGRKTRHQKQETKRQKRHSKKKSER